VGLIVDTNVFISFERTGQSLDLSPWEPSEDIFISVVTVSELLVGVHRADNEARRQRRMTFVEAVIGGIRILDFTAEIARLHAAIFSDLSQQGNLIGAHDLIIAATARHYNLSLLTDNANEFTRIPGLRVIAFSP
jgi:tRNA(fMet)-specific endonuclease VapC